jgi:predicted transcriptional regulator
MRNTRFERRCTYDVIASILRLSKKGATKTEIMYGANLSYALLNKYLNLLVKNGLLKCKKEGKRVLYIMGENGADFLVKYQEIHTLCKAKK